MSGNWEEIACNKKIDDFVSTLFKTIDFGNKNKFLRLAVVLDGKIGEKIQRAFLLIVQLANFM